MRGKARPFLVVPIFIIVCACASAPSEAAVQTAIAQTAGAEDAQASFPEPTETAKPPLCLTEENLAPLEDVEVRFEDAATLADNTPRIQLANVIASMQEIRRDTLDLELAACLSDAQSILVQYMDKIIEGFTNFLAQKAYSASFDAAKVLLQNYQDAFLHLEINDAYISGEVKPVSAAEADVSYILLSEDGHTAEIEIANQGIALMFVTFELSYEWPDETVEIFDQIFVYSLAQGETTTIRYTLTSEQYRRAPNLERLMVSVVETSTPVE